MWGGYRCERWEGGGVYSFLFIERIKRELKTTFYRSVPFSVGTKTEKIIVTIIKINKIPTPQFTSGKPMTGYQFFEVVYTRGTGLDQLPGRPWGHTVPSRPTICMNPSRN